MFGMQPSFPVKESKRIGYVAQMYYVFGLHSHHQ